TTLRRGSGPRAAGAELSRPQGRGYCARRRVGARLIAPAGTSVSDVPVNLCIYYVSKQLLSLFVCSDDMLAQQNMEPLL
ncbi:MAG TPA: hypothetical protein VKU38_00080, partial [Ktedonobacteraceae bacterium]|nr:hypothetical protein [Ktedonobacteraceae bacterium]